MDEQTDRKFLTSQYLGYSEILDRNGIDFIALSEAELNNLPLHDLRKVVHQLRDLARTPRE